MTPTPPRAGGGRALVGIGEVMALLRPEFPDVSVSKIRFLEAEGLVEPQRTPSGYRKFGPSDLDRLRYVLRAQRDQYLPLKVIKDHLDAIDRGLEPAEDGLGAALAAADASPPAPVYFTRAELLAAAGIDDAALTRLEEFGLIEARRVVEAAGTGSAPADADAAADAVAGESPAARGNGGGAGAFEPRRAAVHGGPGADAAAGEVGVAVPGGSADVRTVDAVGSVATGPRGAVGAGRGAGGEAAPGDGAVGVGTGVTGPRGAVGAGHGAGGDVVPGDGAAVAVDVLSARVLDVQRKSAEVGNAAVDAAASAPADASGSARAMDAAHGAGAGANDVPSEQPAAEIEPTGTPGAATGDKAQAADEATAADSAEPETLTEAADAGEVAHTADAGITAPGDAAADAAPDGPAETPPTAPAASEAALTDTCLQEQPGADHADGRPAEETTASSPSSPLPSSPSSASSRAVERPTAGGPPAPTAAQPGAPSSPGTKSAARAGSPRAVAPGVDPAPRTVLRYDGDALVVARLVTALGEYGLEPRHLRQVKAAADREAALAEQIVAPLLHRRGAGAKSGAEETVRDLLSLTSRLHTVLVSAALRPLLDR